MFTEEQQKRIDAANEAFKRRMNRPYTYVVEVSLLMLLPYLPVTVLVIEEVGLHLEHKERQLVRATLHQNKKHFKGAESVTFYLNTSKSATDFWKIERNTRHDLDYTFILIPVREAERLQIARKFQKEDFVKYPGSRLAIANEGRIITADTRPAVRHSVQSIIYFD